MTVIDTFDAAQLYLKTCCSGSAEEALAEWERYISAWPALRELCQGEYGDNWREVFFSHVFPRLCLSIEKMKAAHDNLLAVLPSVTERGANFFGRVAEVNIVVYIGLGNGAGWVTDYEGVPAILFGLENIADLDWTDVASLQYLVAHEICHVAHQALRGKREWSGLLQGTAEDGSLRLYLEGFAERYQELVLGYPAFNRYGASWPAWCKENHIRLCGLYRERIDAGEAVSEFYGNWNHIGGKSDAGYYLGREFVLYLEGLKLDIQQIASLPREKVRQHVKDYLRMYE
jgi:hypothetical protein